MQMSVNSFSVMSMGVSGWGKGAGDDMRVAPDEEETRERDLRGQIARHMAAVQMSCGETMLDMRGGNE